MELNDLLLKHAIDPERVLVLRHRPTEPQLNRVLPWLAAERPEIYNAYQQTQGAQVEKAMLNASHIVSCIGHQPGKALFIGLYAVRGYKPLSVKDYWRIPAYKEMKEKWEMRGFTEAEGRSSICFFDLLFCPDFYGSWKGKLVLNWPPPERSWWRRAHRNSIDIHAIHEESLLDAGMPSWNKLQLDFDDLGSLPTSWKSAFAQWRGIYFIFDSSDRRGYVGSAYGTDNLWQRWENYAATGHGGNRLLKGRDPKHFHFSILELVSPAMDKDDVIRLESCWKERLHTRSPFGLNDN